MTKIYQVLASNVAHYTRLRESAAKSEDALLVEEKLCKMVDKYLPSGSGFDNGTKLDFDKSHKDRLVFNTGFHFMDFPNGYYAGWAHFNVYVTPDLAYGANIRVVCTGFSVQRKELPVIWEYVSEVFHDALFADY